MQRATLRDDYDVIDVIVLGDFNNEVLTLGTMGLVEVHHVDAYHKHARDKAHRYIDKVFCSNPSLVKIGKILTTCENKAENEDGTLGHKFFVLEIGNCGTSTKDKPHPRTNMRMFKKKCKEWKNHTHSNLDSIQKIEDVTDLLIRETQHIRDKCQTKRPTKSRDKKLQAMDALEAMETDTLKKPMATKCISRLYEKFKNGIETIVDSE